MPASTSRLVLEFKSNQTEKTLRFSYNYAENELSSESMRTLANALITNGSIFTFAPTELTAAKIVTTTETDYEITPNP